VADLSVYMTPEEFADLPSDAHHAVWRAHGDGLIDARRCGGAGSVLVYNRAQVLKLLRETEAARG
jgi:hypothetical protein